MADETLHDPRRSPRLLARCRVDVRHRLARWRAETEDLGPDGCQLVTPRLVATGHDVRLSIHVPELGRAVDGLATVVWSRAEQPSRLGLRFQPDRSDRSWFPALLAADPLLASAARRPARALSWRARLYLGAPPRLIVDFSPDELAVLRRIRPAITLAELVATFGRRPERLVGALFALVSRGRVVLDVRETPGPEAWREVLARAETLEAAEGRTPGQPLPSGSVEALLAEGHEHLAAGRVALAAERFRQARALSPDGTEGRAELRRRGPFG